VFVEWRIVRLTAERRASR